MNAKEFICREIKGAGNYIFPSIFSKQTVTRIEKEYKTLRFIPDLGDGKIALAIGTAKVYTEKDPYSDLLFPYLETSFDKKVVFNKNTKEFENIENLSFAIDSFDKNDDIENNVSEAMSFSMEVIKASNIWVYGLFTKETSDTARAINYSLPIVQTKNILKHIDKIDLFEKVAKVNGAKIIFDNLRDDNFELQDAKKLKKVVGISSEATQFLKSMKMEELLPKMQTIFSSGENDGNEFVAYLKAMKKINKFDKYQLLTFIENFSEIIENGYRTRDVLKHLVRENYFLGKLSIPSYLSMELKDIIYMAKQNHLPMDKLPKNIVKYHAILATNCNIMKNPRTEEFKLATSMYNRLEQDSDSNYIIKVPSSEKELLEEGNILHHCVASYRDKIIDDKAIVLFLRKKSEPDEPFVTIEIDEDINFIQVKEKFDADVTDTSVLEYLKKWRLSKRYLVEDGKSIFKEPENKMTKKAQKEALKTMETGK